MSKVREAETVNQCRCAGKRVAAVGRAPGAIAGRPARVGMVLAATGLAMLLSSGAVPIASAHRATATPPAVSPVTVTVPAGSLTAPPVTPLPVTTPPASTSPVKTSPAPSTPSAAPAARTSPSARTAPSAPASTPAVASPAGRGRVTHAPRAPHASSRVAAGAAGVAWAAAAAHHPREFVLDLSQCVSRLSPVSQRLLLLRAGIATAAPASTLAAARTLRISVARATHLWDTALVTLHQAAQTNTCGPMPAWIHVPADHRLVTVDAVFADSTSA